MSRDYKVIETHFGETAESIWRVVVVERDQQFETVGKFPTKEQAEKYITYISQSTERRHNQW